jgi:hypothetical protein
VTAHAELTNQERVDAARFWGDYFRSGGATESPSAFQLDALNDEALRDRVMMWQIAANPAAYNAEMGEYFESEYPEVLEALGESPDARKAQEAIVSVVKDFNDDPTFDADQLDTGAVFVLMHCMWGLLAGEFRLAATMLKTLNRLTARSMELGVTDAPFEAPLLGLSEAAGTFVIYEGMGVARNVLLEESRVMFGLDENHPNVVAARNNFVTGEQKETAHE